MKKSENGRSILEIIFVLFIITLILLAGFYLWDQQKAEVKAHAVTERLVTIKNNRRLSMQAHSEERMPRKEKGPHNTEFSVENGIDQQNSDWFWVTIKTEDTSLCAFLNEANVGADKIDDFCEKEGTTTFYFKKNPQKTTANTPEKNFQPQSCPANSICDKDLNTIGCEENYFLYNFNCLACPENSIECTDNNFECSEGYYKKDKTCQPCDESTPECNPEENNTSSGSGSSGSSSSSSSSDPCKDINCGRHGTCKKGVCICSDNYYGEHCEISPWVCKNGGKWNTTTYECECINGYTGVTCDVLNPCFNVNCGTHGTCSDGACICTDNYYGENCENAPLACQNGGSWNTTTHQCDCPNGYSGNTCGIKDPCLDVNCGAHGTCSGGSCVCTDDYYGEFCENAPLTCLNGGRWNATTLTCDCAQGWGGETCQSKCEDLGFMTCTTIAGCYPVQWILGATSACYSSLESAQTACSPYTLSERNDKGYYTCVDDGWDGGNSTQTTFTCDSSSYLNPVSDNQGNISGHCHVMGCKVYDTPVKADNWLDLCDITVPDGYYVYSLGRIYDSNGNFVQGCAMSGSNVIGTTIESVCGAVGDEPI